MIIVLLCYDGSDHADRSIRRAARLLRPRHAVVVHVRQRPLEDEVAESGRRLALAAGFDPVVAVEAGHGPVAKIVLREARQRGASVIVAGPVFACYDGSPVAREAIAAAAELLAGREAIVATFMPAVDDGAVLRSTLPWPVAPEVRDRLAQLDREEAEAPFERAAEGGRVAAGAGFAARPLGIRGRTPRARRKRIRGCASSVPPRAKRRPASSWGIGRP